MRGNMTIKETMVVFEMWAISVCIESGYKFYLDSKGKEDRYWVNSEKEFDISETFACPKEMILFIENYTIPSEMHKGYYERSGKARFELKDMRFFIRAKTYTDYGDGGWWHEDNEDEMEEISLEELKEYSYQSE